MAEIDLTFIAKQLERVLAEQATARDEMLVTGARISKVERSLERLSESIKDAFEVLTLEVRAMRNQTDRMNNRIHKLEDGWK